MQVCMRKNVNPIPTPFATWDEKNPSVKSVENEYPQDGFKLSYKRSL